MEPYFILYFGLYPMQLYLVKIVPNLGTGSAFGQLLWPFDIAP